MIHLALAGARMAWLGLSEALAFAASLGVLVCVGGGMMRGRMGGGTTSPFALSLGRRHAPSECRAGYSRRDVHGVDGAHRGEWLDAIAAELWVVAQGARLGLGEVDSGGRAT